MNRQRDIGEGGKTANQKKPYTEGGLDQGCEYLIPELIENQVQLPRAQVSKQSD